MVWSDTDHRPGFEENGLGVFAVFGSCWALILFVSIGSSRARSNLLSGHPKKKEKALAHCSAFPATAGGDSWTGMGQKNTTKNKNANKKKKKLSSSHTFRWEGRRITLATDGGRC